MKIAIVSGDGVVGELRVEKNEIQAVTVQKPLGVSGNPNMPSLYTILYLKNGHHFSIAGQYKTIDELELHYEKEKS